MGISTGLATGLAAAAPGLMQGGQQLWNAATAPPQINQGAINTADNNAVDQMHQDFEANGGAGNPLADPNHPAWQVMANMTGGQGGPLAGGNTPDDGAGAGAGGVAGMQNGGVVKLNSGSKTIRPSFTRAPAIPVGPNSGVVPNSGGAPVLGMANGGVVPGRGSPLGQGITPASTEGELLTMDAGGVVPDGFQQAAVATPPMTGRAAGLVSGFAAGQTLGRNIHDAWMQHEANSGRAAYGDKLMQADINSNPTGAADPNASGTPGGIHGALDNAKNSVEGFFQHLWNGTLNDAHQPNNPAAVHGADSSAVPGNPSGAIPTPPPAASGGSPGAGAIPGAPAPAAAGGAPAAPAAAPSPGSPPAPAASAGAVPGAPAPAAGAPAAGAPAAGAPASAGGGPGQSAPASPVAAEQQQDSQAAVQLANAKVKASGGVPDQSPSESGLPHSLTPEYYAELQRLKAKAVHAAAMAGEDPAKVYESLNAMQNAHFQGQIVKQLATANVAFQNGDMDSVKKALSNVNYYLPNGQGMTFKTATPADAAQYGAKPGDLLYANPFYKMYGHEGENEYTKVDSQHIQMLGVAALDPMSVQKAQLASYSAQAEAKEKQTAAEGALRKGIGVENDGTANLTKAQLAVSEAPVEMALKRAQTALNYANAGKATREPIDRSGNGQPKVTVASLTARQKAVDDYLESTAAGAKRVDPNTPAYSPAYGKAIPNPGLVPSSLQNLKNPDQMQRAHIYGGQIAGANPDIPIAEAADLGARIVHMESMTVKPTHTGPDGKKYPDFYQSEDGRAHVWLGNGYRTFYSAPAVADEGPQAVPTETASPVGGGGEGGGGGGPASAAAEATNE